MDTKRLDPMLQSRALLSFANSRRRSYEPTIETDAASSSATSCCCRITGRPTKPSENPPKPQMEDNLPRLQSKSRTRGKRRCEKTTNFALPIVCSLVILLTITLVPLQTSATSNINSVWLAAQTDDASKGSRPTDSHSDSVVVSVGRRSDYDVDELLDKLPGYTGSSQASAPSEHGVGGQWKPAATSQLQVAASSLQPAIVSAEGSETRVPVKQTVSRRRLLTSGPVVKPLSAGRGFSRQSNGSFSDAATSLDHMWSANQTNAQVEFDEEHSSGGSNGRNRRQDFNETSTVVPQHELPGENHQLAFNDATDDDLREVSKFHQQRRQPQYQQQQQTKNQSSSQPYEIPAVMNDYLSDHEISRSRNSTHSNDRRKSHKITGDDVDNDTNDMYHTDQSGGNFLDEIYHKNQNHQNQSSIYSTGGIVDNSNKWNVAGLNHYNYSSSSFDSEEPLIIETGSGSSGGFSKYRGDGGNSNITNLQYDLRLQNKPDYYHQQQQQQQVFPVTPIMTPRTTLASGQQHISGGGGIDLVDVSNEFNDAENSINGGNTHLSDQNPLTSTTAGNINNNKWPHHQSGLSYGFVPRTTTGTTSNAGYHTTPMPFYTNQPQAATVMYMNPSTATTPFHLQQPHYAAYGGSNRLAPLTPQYKTRLHPLRPSSLVAPQTVKHPVRFQYSRPLVPPKSSKQRPRTLLVNGNDIGNTRRQTIYNPVQRLRQSPDIVRGSGSSFLRNYGPMFNYVNHRPTVKPKKSLLGSLGEKLNTWSGNDNGNSLASASSLESSFYEGLPPVPATSSRLRAQQAQQFSIVMPSHNQQGHLYGLHQGSPFRNSQVGASVLRPEQLSAMSYLNPMHGNYNSFALQQPTVAPAPSSPLSHGFYGNGYSALGYPPSPTRHLSGAVGGSQQSQHSNFIPVVAVEVTKTSPAPRPMQQMNLDSSNDNNQQQLFDTSNEIDEYLETKFGKTSIDRSKYKLNKKQHADKSIHTDDFGDSAAGSVTRNSSPVRMPPTANGQIDGQHDHVTTVKSAVFGYLPHQAEAHLVQAINMLPQISPLARNSISSPTARMNPHIPLTSDMYANQRQQHDQPHQVVGQTSHSLLNSHPFQPSANYIPADAMQGASGSIEEPPSLALQLQANNFVQNDIAHPFGVDASGSSHRRGSASTFATGVHPQDMATGYHYAAAPSSHSVDHVKPIDVYSSNQAAQLQEFQFLPTDAAAILQQQQQQQQYGNANQMLHNPLLGASNAAIDANSLRNHQLFAAASEMSPLLPSILLAANPVFQFDPNQQQQMQQVGQQVAESQDYHSAVNAGASGTTDPNAEESSPSLSGNSLNHKNRKRSSEFFANAGQLLLSALPLLLAPTLGLMFASSPNPVARYQSQNSLHSSSSGIHSGIPGTYINSLNSGFVSNASPAPQLFTPTPPGYNMSAITTVRPRKPSSPKFSTTPIPLKSILDRSHNQHRNSNSSANSSSTTTSKPLAILLTTLSPAPFGDLHNSSGLSNSSSDSNSTNLDSRQTFLLLTQDDSPNESSDSSPERAQDRSNMSTILPPEVTISTSTSTTEHPSRHHYDIGYEGVDFDAQFASLRRSNSASRMQPSAGQFNYITETPLVVSSVNNSRNKNRYHYSEIMSNENLPIHLNANRSFPLVSVDHISNNFDNYTSNDDDDDYYGKDTSTKLYPVVTLPPFRRRTVSLVTSNGNRTLIDSSDKYHSHLDSGSPLMAHSNHQRAANRRRTATATSALLHEEPHRRSSATQRPQSYPSPGKPHQQASNASASLNINGDRAKTITKVTTSAPAIRFLSRKKRATDEASDGRPNEDAGSLEGKNELKSNPSVRNHRVKIRVKRIKRRPQSSSSDVSGHRASESVVSSSTEQPNAILPVQGEINPSGALESGKNLSTSLDPESMSEPMKGDASRSKTAHVITAVVSHSDDGDNNQSSSSSDEYSPNDAIGDATDTVSIEELKDQLVRRKMLLDRMSRDEAEGRHHHYSTGSERLGGDADDESSSYLGTGGRGRIPPTPIEVTSTKIRVFANGSSENDKSRASTRVSRNGLVLNEDTRKALANFGTLLLKDSLRESNSRMKTPTSEDEEATGGKRQSRKQPRNGLYRRGDEYDITRHSHTHGASNNYSDHHHQGDRYYHQPIEPPSRRNHRNSYYEPTTGDVAATEQNPYRAASPPDNPLVGEMYRDLRREPAPQLHGATPQHYHDGRRAANRSVGEYGEYDSAPGSSKRLRSAINGTSVDQTQDRADYLARPQRNRLSPLDLQSDAIPRPSYPNSDDRLSSASVNDIGGYSNELGHYATPDRYSDGDRYNHKPVIASGELHHHQNSSSLSRYNSFLASHVNSSIADAGIHALNGNTSDHIDSSSDSRYPSSSNHSVRSRVEPLSSSPTTGYNDHYGGYFNSYYTGPNRHNRSPYPPEDSRNYSSPNAGHYHYGAREPALASSYGTYDSYYHNKPPNNPLPPPPLPQHYNHHSQSSYENDYPLAPSSYRPPDRPPYNAPLQPPPLPQAPVPSGYSGQQSQQRYSSYPGPEMSGYNRLDPPEGHPNAYPTRSAPGDYYAPVSGAGGARGYDYSQQHAPAATNEFGSTNSVQHPLSALTPPNERSEAKTVNEYLKRVHFSDSDRDKLMASYLTCDGLLNDNDHCLERLSCEFSDPQNIEKANKLDRAVSSILLGHILINTYIPNQFKLRLKSASLFGYTQSGKCSRFVCNKLTKANSGAT